MNDESWKFAEKLIPETYVRQAADATKNRENVIRQLLQHVSLMYVFSPKIFMTNILCRKKCQKMDGMI